MGNDIGVSRGDRNRNARLDRLRVLVPVNNAIVGIDLADKKQMVVVCDHDSRVLARRTFRCRAWDLGATLDWAGERAAAKGFAGATVACEPTGHRWRILGQLAGERSMPFVCVQPSLTSWARRSEDLTHDKTDEKDAVLIARLTAQLRCYVPEPVDETWARLRHLGARREQLIVEMVSQVQQMRALLECVWPASLETAKQPFRSRTWAAAMAVICERGVGDLDRTRRLGPARFEHAVRREITKRGGQKPSLRIVRRLFTALADPAGVLAHRPGAMERVAFLLADWQAAAGKLTDTETRMVAVLNELNLTGLVTSITGLSPVGAAAILAETGDPRRFATARALVKHAGLAPREKMSGTFIGRTKLTGQGRPGLRTPSSAPAKPGTRSWPPTEPVTGRRPWLLDEPAAQAGGRGEPHAALRHHGDLDAHQGQPRPSSHQPDHTLLGPNPITAMQGQTTDEAPTKRLTENDSR